MLAVVQNVCVGQIHPAIGRDRLAGGVPDVRTVDPFQRVALDAVLWPAGTLANVLDDAPATKEHRSRPDERGDRLVAPGEDFGGRRGQAAQIRQHQDRGERDRRERRKRTEARREHTFQHGLELAGPVAGHANVAEPAEAPFAQARLRL